MVNPPTTREGRFELLIGTVRDYTIFMLDVRGYVDTWSRDRG